MSDPYESINEIVETNCIKCGAKIDCRRFICEKCYNNLMNNAKELKMEDLQ